MSKFEKQNINKSASASKDNAELDAQLKKDQELLAKINELKKTGDAADDNISKAKKDTKELDADDIMAGVEDLQKGLSGEGNFAMPKKTAEKDTKELDADDIMAGVEDLQKGPKMEDFQKNSQEKKNPEMSEKPKNQENPENKEEKQKLRNEKIADIRKELEEVRKDYLKFDYKKNTTLVRIRKFFKNVKNDDPNKNLEQDEEISWHRAQYDNKLFDLQKLLIEDAKEKGASDKELADLFAEFRTEQKITLADEHDKVKIEQQEGKAWGLVGHGMVELVKKYQGLSFAKKMGIAGLFLAGGLALGGAGGATAGFVTVMIGARRLFGGLTAGVGTRLGLEAIGQRRDRKNVEKEKQEFLEKLKNMTEEEKYDLLSGNIKNIAIKDEENSINKIKNQDINQLAIGAIVGTLVGHGDVARAAGKVFNVAADYFSGTQIGSHVIESVQNNFAKIKDAVGGIKDHMAGGGHVAEMAKEVVPSGENLTIEKGGNFWAAIDGKLDNIEPGINHDDATNLILHDAAKEYANSHGITVDEAMSKLSRINPGTEFSMTHDSAGWHAHFNDEKIKFMKGIGHHHAPSGSVDHPAAAETAEAPKADVSEKPAFTDNNNIPENGDLTEKAEIARKSAIEGLNKQHEELAGKIAAQQKELDSYYTAEAREKPLLMQGVSDSFKQDELLKAINENKAALVDIDNKLHELNSIHADHVTDNMPEVPNDHPGVDNMPMEKGDLTEKGRSAMENITNQNSGGSNIHEAPSGTGAGDVAEHAAPAPEHAAPAPEHVAHAPEQHISGHFDADHPLELESGTASFQYDSQGNITGGKLEISKSFFGGSGRELLNKNFNEIIYNKSDSGISQNLIRSAIISKSHELNGFMDVYNEMQSKGYTKEAEAVLKRVYSLMNMTEKRYGVTDLFDRTKLPPLSK